MVVASAAGDHVAVLAPIERVVAGPAADGVGAGVAIDAVVAAATSPELAVEIYAASVLAIDPDDPAEQAYLAMLASRLKLDPGLRASIEAEAAKAMA